MDDTEVWMTQKYGHEMQGTQITSTDNKMLEIQKTSNVQNADETAEVPFQKYGKKGPDWHRKMKTKESN